ncbi:hypothetical protein [Streptomyces chartreusis]|uniref:hypothetical protein n=1 Tax=Streptomyces chartreusis TaxID=1969 RepID=UPI00382AB9AB
MDRSSAGLPAKKRDGDYGPGYAVRGNGYVALDDIRKTLGAESFESACALVDGVVSRSVLRRGLLLNCARCRVEAFYRIEQTGSTFGCEAALRAHQPSGTRSLVQKRRRASLV